MYVHEVHDFHPFQRHEIRSPDGQHSLSVIPDHGACLQGLRLHGRDLLWSDATGREKDIDRWARGDFLFPFPNRLRDGHYEWEGEHFAFPLNDPLTHNAIHGYVASQVFEASRPELSAGQGRMTFRYRDKGQRDAYPFAYEIEQDFELRGERGLRIKTTVRNTGSRAMPAAWGWHPYFVMAPTCDEVYLRMPDCKMIGVDDRMLPSGKRYDYDRFEQSRQIGVEVLDNCFALNPDEGIATLELSSSLGKLRYAQETGLNKYNFVQVFTLPERNALAIEPMTGNVDALNNGEGLIRLEPGESASAAFGVQFDPA